MKKVDLLLMQLCSIFLFPSSCSLFNIASINLPPYNDLAAILTQSADLNTNPSNYEEIFILPGAIELSITTRYWVKGNKTRVETIWSTSENHLINLYNCDGRVAYFYDVKRKTTKNLSFYGSESPIIVNLNNMASIRIMPLVRNQGYYVYV